eukprot:gene31733-6932_t
MGQSIRCMGPSMAVAWGHDACASGRSIAVFMGHRYVDVIVAYYTAYNKGDTASIGKLLAEDVSYHDMIYEEPFVGRTTVVKYLNKVLGILGSEASR